MRPGQPTDAEWIGQLLGEWQAHEIRLAHGYPECHDLSREQLEDLYQETSVVLLTRRYQTEEHLLNALRMGIKHRAKNLHRDERRRSRILAHSAPGMYAIAQVGAGEDAPELAAIVRQDRLIVAEFLTELSPVEQRVFWLLAEGMQYRGIAPALGLEVNVARNAARAVERKRERFQLLYDTGRLCGFRAATITALQSGQAATGELAERAFAHLDSCARCRAEHKTNAKRLRGRFQGQATALLPVPALAAHLGWLARVDARVRTWVDRFIPGGVPGGSGSVREGAVALLTGGGATAKVAATFATVVVQAGGATAGVVIEPGGHAKARVKEPVAAGVRLTVTPRHASAQGSITLAGTVQRPVPPRGATVDVLVHYRGRWESFRTTRNTVGGRFRVVYQFEGGVGRFPFRGEVPRRSDRLPGREGHKRVLGTADYHRCEHARAAARARRSDADEAHARRREGIGARPDQGHRPAARVLAGDLSAQNRRRRSSGRCAPCSAQPTNPWDSFERIARQRGTNASKLSGANKLGSGKASATRCVGARCSDGPHGTSAALGRMLEGMR